MKIKPFTGTQLCWNWLSGQNGKRDIDSHSGTAVLKQGVVTFTSTEEIWFQPKLKICIQNEAMRYGPRNRAVSLEVAYSVSKICSNQCSKAITNRGYSFGPVTCLQWQGKKGSFFFFVFQLWFQPCESFSLHFRMQYTALHYLPSLFFILQVFIPTMRVHHDKKRPTIVHNSSYKNLILKHFTNTILQHNILVGRYWQQKQTFYISPML